MFFASASVFESSFPVAAGKKECIGQDTLKHVLSVVQVSSKEGLPLSLTVLEDRTPIYDRTSCWSHHTIFSEGHQTGSGDDSKKVTSISTAYTAQRDATHWICVLNESATEKTEVRFSLRMGAAAKDYSQIARREHLDGVQVHLRRVQDQLDLYQENLLKMRHTDSALRALNDNTGVRVIVFCALNVTLMIVLGGWQVLSFKSFFREKKII
eukprot:g2903.t1